jgi:hypothetical protein
MKRQSILWSRVTTATALLLGTILLSPMLLAVSVEDPHASGVQAQNPNTTSSAATPIIPPSVPPRKPGPFLRNGGPAPRGLPGVPPLVSRPSVSRGAVDAGASSQSTTLAPRMEPQKDRTAITASGNFIYVVQDGVLYQFTAGDLRLVRQVRLTPLMDNVPGGQPSNRRSTDNRRQTNQFFPLEQPGQPSTEPLPVSSDP